MHPEPPQQRVQDPEPEAVRDEEGVGSPLAQSDLL